MLAVPPPGPGEVRLRHTAIGVNFIDIYCRTGYFRLLTPPGVPGMEAAGVVTMSARASRTSAPVTASSTPARRSAPTRRCAR